MQSTRVEKVTEVQGGQPVEVSVEVSVAANLEVSGLHQGHEFGISCMTPILQYSTPMLYLRWNWVMAGHLGTGVSQGPPLDSAAKLDTHLNQLAQAYLTQKISLLPFALPTSRVQMRMTFIVPVFCH